MIFLSDMSHINRKAMKFSHKFITTITTTQANRGHTIIIIKIVSIHLRNATKASINALERPLLTIHPKIYSFWIKIKLYHVKVDVAAFATHFSAGNFNAPSSRNRRLKFRQNSDFAVFTAAAASGCVPVSENSFKYPAVCLGKRARPIFYRLEKRARPVFCRLGKRARVDFSASGSVPELTFLPREACHGMRFWPVFKCIKLYIISS